MEVERIAALQRLDRRKLPAAGQHALLERQRIDGAYDKAIAGVKIRQAAVAGDIVAILNHESFYVPRVVINRLRERIGPVELQTPGQRFRHGDPESLIGRVAVALINIDVSKRQAGVDRTVGREGGIGANAVHKLIVIAFDIKIGSLAADVADAESVILSQPLLDIEVPL